MATITKITIEGFVSIIEKLKYKFDNPGVNLILGKNGSGKTTIFNALAWCLYGQTLKPKSSILPWPHTIDSQYRGCKVSVELDDGYKIIRCNEFKDKVLGKAGKNRLLIVDGPGKSQLGHLRGNKEAQQWINNHLGYTFQLFKTSVLFAQELSSLIEEDGPTKKRTFDEAFQSAFINRAKDKVEVELNQLTQEYGKAKDRLDSKIELLENNQELLGSLETEIRRFGIQKAKEIRDLRGKVRANKKEANNLKKGKDISIEKKRLKQEAKELGIRRDSLANTIDPFLEKDHTILTKDLEKLGDDLKRLEKDLESLKDLKPNCKVCGAKLTGKKFLTYKKKIGEQREKLREERKGIINVRKFTIGRINVAQTKIEEQDNIKDEIMLITLDIDSANNEWHGLNIIDTKLKALRTANKEIKKEINRVRKRKLTNNTDPIKENIARFEGEVKECQDQIKSLEEKIALQRWLIKDPLSNSGLKAFIFDSMLNKVNYYLKYYTQFTGFQVRVGMDLESSNKDFMISIIKNGDEVPYYDFSKGQKQLAKVVLCFALNDSIDTSKPLNIMLMDELFESLDPENIEVVSTIIMAKAKKKSIHLISHKSAFNPTQCRKTFIMLNSKGQTVIEQKYKEA